MDRPPVFSAAQEALDAAKEINWKIAVSFIRIFKLKKIPRRWAEGIDQVYQRFVSGIWYSVPLLDA